MLEGFTGLELLPAAFIIVCLAASIEAATREVVKR